MVRSGSAPLPFERDLQLPRPLPVVVVSWNPVFDTTAGEPPVQPNDFVLILSVSVTVPLLLSVSGGLNVIVPVMSEHLKVPVPVVLAIEAAAARFGAMTTGESYRSATARAPNMILRNIDPPRFLAVDTSLFVTW